tara:strand:- start:49405 stop:49830 length:426 start_codon:yes stop_codon:yes gene_type:complete
MGTGQTLLTISAIALYSITLNNIVASHVNSVKYALQQQETSEAVEIGNSITEQLFAASASYDDLEDQYGALNDVSKANARENFETQMGDSVAVTYQLGKEKEMVEGELGRKLIVNVYKKNDISGYKKVSEHVAVVLKGGVK